MKGMFGSFSILQIIKRKKYYTSNGPIIPADFYIMSVADVYSNDELNHFGWFYFSFVPKFSTFESMLSVNNSNVL